MRARTQANLSRPWLTEADASMVEPPFYACPVSKYSVLELLHARRGRETLTGVVPQVRQGPL